MGRGSITLRRALAGFGAAYVVVLIIALIASYCGVSLGSHGGWLSGPGVVLNEAYMAVCVVLLVASVMAPLGFLARTVARARLRAGHDDPFAGARRWIAAHPDWTRALTAAPAVPLAIAYCFGWPLWRWWEPSTLALVGILPVFAAGLPRFFRRALHALVAPLVDEREAAHAGVADDGDITFDAVAVTLETRAAVAGMALLPVALVLLMNALDSRGTHDGAAIGAFVAVSLGGAALFRRASRIRVGLDGVLVKGTSRTRFFAYRDLDYVHPKGDDLVLVRGGRVVLRLQLHGKDAARRAAVLERVRGAIRRAKEERGDPTTDFVASASRGDLARAAEGAGDYRAAAVSREQLWDIVTGPTIDAGARRSAAVALAKSADGDERARLRVAAEHCADPKVRVALHRLADGQDLEEEEHAAPLQRARLR